MRISVYDEKHNREQHAMEIVILWTPSILTRFNCEAQRTQKQQQRRRRRQQQQHQLNAHPLTVRLTDLKNQWMAVCAMRRTHRQAESHAKCITLQMITWDEFVRILIMPLAFTHQSMHEQKHAQAQTQAHNENGTRCQQPVTLASGARSPIPKHTDTIWMRAFRCTHVMCGVWWVCASNCVQHVFCRIISRTLDVKHNGKSKACHLSYFLMNSFIQRRRRACVCARAVRASKCAQTKEPYPLGSIVFAK